MMNSMTAGSAGRPLPLVIHVLVKVASASGEKRQSESTGVSIAGQLDGSVRVLGGPGGNSISKATDEGWHSIPLSVLQ